MTLANFVNGAFKGYQAGEMFKDQKTKRKNDAEDREMRKEDRSRRHSREDAIEGRAVENHAYTQEQRGRQRKEEDRLIERRDEEERVYAEAYDDAKESYSVRDALNPNAGGTIEAPAQPLIEVQPNEAPRPQAAPTAAIGASTQTAPAQPFPPSAASALPAVDQPADVMPPNFANDPEVLKAASAMGLTPEQAWQQTDPMTRSAFAGGPTPSPAAPLPPRSVREAIPDPNARQGMALPADGYPEAFTQNASVQDAVKRGYSLEKIWAQIPESSQNRMMRPYQTPPSAAQPQVQQVAPQVQFAPSVADAMRQETPAAQPAPNMPAMPQALQAQAQAPAAPQVAEDPNLEAAQQTVAKTSDKLAAQGKSVLTRAGRVTKEARKEASDNFMDHYTKVAVPKIMEHYLRTGQPEKAMKFEEWRETREAKEIQKQFGELTFTLAVGDLDSAMDHLDGMYSQVNDGYDLVKEESRFEYGPDGNPIRAVFTIKNNDTGEVFEQVVEGQGDLAQQLLGIVNPEGAFEHLMQRQDQAIALRAKKAAEAGKDAIDRKELAAEEKRLKDDYIDEQANAPYGSEPIVIPSSEEIRRMALKNVMARERALSGQRSYHTGQPTADWRG